MKGHLIPRECGIIAKEALVKKLVLTHFYPLPEEGLRLKETKEVFNNTEMATDLMTIEI